MASPDLAPLGPGFSVESAQIRWSAQPFVARARYKRKRFIINNRVLQSKVGLYGVII